MPSDFRPRHLLRGQGNPGPAQCSPLGSPWLPWEVRKAGMKTSPRVRAGTAGPWAGRGRRELGGRPLTLPRPPGLPQSAPDLGHLGQWSWNRVPALLPACGRCGGLHSRGVSCGGSRWVPGLWGEGSQEGHLLYQFPHPCPLRAVNWFNEQLLSTSDVPAYARILLHGFIPA